MPIIASSGGNAQLVVATELDLFTVGEITIE
jgi:hypothetical protein